MSTIHYILFIGAKAHISNELIKIEKRFSHVRVISLAEKKKNNEINDSIIEKTLKTLSSKLPNNLIRSRLSIWCFLPKSSMEIQRIVNTFGKAGWIEFIPNSLNSSASATREYIENLIKKIESDIHHVAYELNSRKNTSPLPLPLLNFKSEISDELQNFWYKDDQLISLEIDEIEAKINQIHIRHRQKHLTQDNSHKDNRRVLFKAAHSNQFHGKLNKTGYSERSFMNGYFRFGATLIDGFHYDVRTERGNILRIDVFDENGIRRDLSPEKRTYINIFPNELILPRQ